MPDTTLITTPAPAPPAFVWPPATSPEIDAAQKTVDTLQDRIDTQLDRQIEAAIHRADAVEVRRLRDSRSDLLGQLYEAQVALIELKIPYAEAQDRYCGQEAGRVSKLNETKRKEANAILAEADELSHQNTSTVQAMFSFRDQGHKLTQELAELKQTETMRMRKIAAES